MPGYWYDTNHLPTPLPVHHDSRLVYTLAFPQSDSEKNTLGPRQVFIRLGNQTYPLLFPEGAIFYRGRYTFFVNRHALQTLFIPINLLVFSDGTPAKPWVTPGYNTSTYFEMYPIDSSGIPQSTTLPWTSSAWSGCDG